MEIHPTVLQLMARSAENIDQLNSWVEHHHRAQLVDVEAAQEADEHDAYQDAVGWD